MKHYDFTDLNDLESFLVMHKETREINDPSMFFKTFYVMWKFDGVDPKEGADEFVSALRNLIALAKKEAREDKTAEYEALRALLRKAVEKP